MSFDKIKAMRNAERFLAQGKIRAAINEYKRVVESDPRDFSTLNMLGDLYAKASDTQEAVKCFNEVAEHYGKQGFSQKAIAVYNKISRLSPDSWEISAKLAELYQMKGSVAEARSHYAVVAEQYQRKGNKAGALMVLRQIAQLDPNNTEIHLKIAEACLQENQIDDAATAYIEAGLKFSAKKQHEAAITAFSKGLEIRPNDLNGLKGIVQAQISLGYTDEAAKTLEKVLEREPYNREVIFLLVDCYLDTNNPQDAERVVIQLIEREPANYLKLIDVVKSYLKEGDLVSAARILSMTSEHLLVGGQAQELEKWVNEILARNPEQLEALRLLVHLHGWQRDEAQLKDSLERLAEAARLNAAVDDERYALTQLVMMVPHEGSYAERLQEINETHGYAEVPLDFQPQQTEFSSEVPEFESFAVSENDVESASNFEATVVDYGEFAFDTTGVSGGSSNGSKETFPAEAAEEYGLGLEPQAFEINGNGHHYPANGNGNSVKQLDRFEQARLQQELESVDFYLSQGYLDLAGQSLDLLESELGSRPEIDKYRQQLLSPDGARPAQNGKVEQTAVFVDAEIQPSEPAEVLAPAAVATGEASNELLFSEAEISDVALPTDAKAFDILDEFRNELGLEESEEATAEGDHETHYHLGIAYKEMGLMEEAIREFQDAINLVSPNDGTRRFFLCCNLLGHCFMEKQMPNLALMWYKRCLETANLTPDERQGLRYEVANAYEAGGENQKAIEYFEEIYVENVDYRDVAERLDFLRS